MRDRLSLIERENKKLLSLIEGTKVYPSERSGFITPNAYNYETFNLPDRRKVAEDTIGASIEARGGAARSLKNNGNTTTVSKVEDFLQSTQKKITSQKKILPN